MVDLGGYVIVLVEQNSKIKIYGSAADRSDCDEILEINGKSLDDSTHQQIIQHIHQCIRSRTICLRVKRRTSGKLAIDTSLIDAFVIGSRAREHLQHIAKDNTITPRDIAQLSKILCESSTTTTSEETNNKVIVNTTTITATTHLADEDDESITTDRPQAADLQTIDQNNTKTIIDSQVVDNDDDVEEILDYQLNDDNMELVELSGSHNLSPTRQSTTTTTHRELPVDVPESFVAPPQRTSSQAPQNDKLKKYSEELSHKKAEEEFLRSSLRGSKKLQQLEQFKTLTATTTTMTNKDNNKELEAMVNDAFEDDEDIDDDYDNDQHMGSTEANNKVPSPDLNVVLERLINNLNGEVKDLINQSNLAKLIAIYTTIMQTQQKQKHRSLLPQPPIITTTTTSTTSSTTTASNNNNNNNTADLVQEVIQLLQEEALNTEAAELLEILTRFELEGLCYAYDHIAQSSKTQLSSSSTYLSPNQDITVDKSEVEILDEVMDDSSVKVVRIEKSSCEPLGATVRNEQDGSVIIGRIVKGGAAEKSGLLHENDEILEVNGIEMKGRNVNQVCDLLAEMTGTLTFVIAIRDNIKDSESIPHQMIHLKALFDYDPDEDLYIPCRELGICFNKGDILHVIDQSDMNWWQAYREGEHDQSLAGLVPSIHFQIQRETMKQSVLNDSTNISTINSKNRQNNNKKTSASSLLLNCGKKSVHRKKKHRKSQNFMSPNDEILSYEEVSLYYPRANIKRPIVLIGPTNIGRHELRQRLMHDTDRFAAAVPHTSRSRRDGEIDAIDYHFISRQQFEQDIKDGRFVEHGEYERNYYGTSLSAIETVVQSGKICVLNLHVHSIPLLRQGQAGAKLKPYFVFVTPPPQIEKLNRLMSMTTSNPQHHHQQQQHHHHHYDTNNSSSTDLQSIIDEARDIEARYGHYFDMILSITDIERAYQELLREINALEREPQWIPNQWLR
ncbi:protein PALS1-like isoform X2 [Oppia nitens]|uniref:protein PALS1-like isoform X2 n=1 Tax=Oppia nitens TaxID=1686743 RepID=UPI0023DB9F06|nr:protein PALS1-like isoform X2 [Oppia nitens]